MRFFALVLVPNTLSEAEVTDAAADLLYPFMHDDDEPDKDYKFDYMIMLEDYAEEIVGEYRWVVAELDPDSLADLEIEALITPDGQWHEPDDPSVLWDDPQWLAQVRELFRKHPDTIAVKFVLHS